jgi:hypothetical protein
MAHHMCPAHSSFMVGAGLIGETTDKSRGERGGVAGRDQRASPVWERLSGPANVAGDHRPRARHRFQWH